MCVYYICDYQDLLTGAQPLNKYLYVYLLKPFRRATFFTLARNASCLLLVQAALAELDRRALSAVLNSLLLHFVVVNSLLILRRILRISVKNVLS